MAGTFTHLALVYSLCRDVDALNSIPYMTSPMKRALMGSMKFCDLGAVSPDYPYLTLLNNNAAGWANVMHYWNTADLIRRAIPIIYEMHYGSTNALHSIAWIFGYLAHVITDLTVHPVINLKVGRYEENKTEHRVCEMNQDVYIFSQMGLGNIINAEYIRDCGIAACSDPNDKKKLDPIISSIWSGILNSIPLSTIELPDGVTKPDSAAELDKWHNNFVFMIDKIADEGGSLPPISRHFAEQKGLVYPDLKNLNLDYIKNLSSPNGGSMHFDELFRITQENIKQGWSELAHALDKGKPEFLLLANGNLDTGLSGSQSIFWSA